MTYITITWQDLEFIAALSGFICLIAGFAINELRHYVKNNPEKVNRAIQQMKENARED